MAKKATRIGDYLNDIFVIHGEMIEENGEDWFLYSVGKDYAILSVCDGCGGIGGRKYAEYENKSGAYIASRISSGAMYHWFRSLEEEGSIISGNHIGELSNGLKAAITKELSAYEPASGGSGIKGALVKSFPTTLSAILFSVAPHRRLQASYVWAGDSRGYVWTQSGLVQMTTDDIESTNDAMDNLSEDSKLSNMVTAKGDFTLNSRTLSRALPCVLITATDGAFGYLSTPMEFEYMLSTTLERAKTQAEWKQLLNDAIRQVTGDDYTIGIATLGYKNFKQLKRLFEGRKKFLFDRYISKLTNASVEEKRRLWEDYKANYYRS